MRTRNHEKDAGHGFECFCKTVMKRQAINIYHANQRRDKREVSFSELSAEEEARLAVTDTYFADEHIFDVHGEYVSIMDDDLSDALHALTTDKRDIVLMAYLLDMSDKEIAQRLNMGRSTIARKRVNTLDQLKKIMNESED